MLQSMRENTKIILWIVIAAFIGLIFAVWGADLSQTGGGGGKGVMSLGNVNGRDLSAEAFDRAFTEEMNLYRGDTDVPVLPAIAELLRERAWNRLVQSTIVDQELAKADIVISDEEIVHSIRTNPPDFLRQNEAFLTEGRFDYQKYRQAIDDPTVDWRWLENYYRSQLPYDHLRQRVAASAKVTEGELRDLYVQSSETVDFSYVAFLPAEFEDTELDATEAEGRAWHDSHEDDYRVPPRAALDYVRLVVEPSEEDYGYLRTRMGEIVQRISEGTPFEDLARYYSEGPTAAQGGEIGIFKRGQMTEKLDEIAFNLDEGEVSDVIEEGNSFQIIQVAEKSGSGPDLSLRIRQIVLTVEAGGETVEATRVAAEELQAEAEESGLREAAKAKSIACQTTIRFEEGSYVPGLGEFRAANLFAFAGEIGDASVPIYQNDSYYILGIALRDSAQVERYEEVAGRVKRDVIRQKRLDLAKAATERFTDAAPGPSLEDLARRAGRNVEKVDLVSRIGSVPGIGRDSKLVLAAFASPEGEAAGPYHTDFGSFYVRREKVTPIDEERYLQEKALLLRSLLTQRQDYIFNKWLEKRVEEAEIEDLRPEIPALQQG